MPGDDIVIEDENSRLGSTEENYEQRRERQAKRQQAGGHLRYARHPDLHHLWCWGTRIDWMLEDHPQRSCMDGHDYLPTPECSAALLRLSYKHPHVIADLKEWLSKVEAEFSVWKANPTKRSEYDLNEMLGILSDRILANTDIIANVEGVIPNPPKVQSKIRSWDSSADAESAELDAIIEADDDDADAIANRRPAYQRDHLFLNWYEESGAMTYHSPAAIRDKWNAMSHEQRTLACPGSDGTVSSTDVVDKAMRKARSENN